MYSEDEYFSLFFFILTEGYKGKRKMNSRKSTSKQKTYRSDADKYNGEYDYNIES